MKPLIYFAAIVLILCASCNKENINSIPDPDLQAMQSHLWKNYEYNFGTVITYGAFFPFVSVKLGADNHYQIIRSLDGIPSTLLDTLNGTYVFDPVAKTVKFSGLKIKQIKRPRVNLPEEVYFADWKLTKISADSLKINLDYGTYPTEPGMEFQKILVKK